MATAGELAVLTERGGGRDDEETTVAATAGGTLRELTEGTTGGGRSSLGRPIRGAGPTGLGMNPWFSVAEPGGNEDLFRPSLTVDIALGSSGAVGDVERLP